MPQDRALDIAVIGLGQGGGNLAAQLSQLGYRVIALNTALTDLSALGETAGRAALQPDQRVYIGIDGYDGAGGDLNYGRECIRENADRIRKAVVDHVEDADIVLITAGLGGGTGSAASELVKTIEDLHLPIVVLATLPTENESGMAKVNAVRGASALLQQQNLSWIFVDNSRLAKRHCDVGIDRYFDTINSVIVSPIDAINRINHGTDQRPIRTLDGEDLRRLLLSGGIINYATDQLPGLEAGAVVQNIREALGSSSLMPTGYALEEVTTIGVVIQAPEDMLSHTPFSFFERLSEHIKETTNGAASYLGVYRSSAKGSFAQLRLICSSPQVPDGIIAMVNDARREGSVLRDKLHQTLTPLDVGEIEDFDLFRTSLRVGPALKGRRRRPSLADVVDDGLNLAPGAARVRRPSPAKSTSTGAAPAQETPRVSRPAPAEVREAAPNSYRLSDAGSVRPGSLPPSIRGASAVLGVGASTAPVATGGERPLRSVSSPPSPELDEALEAVSRLSAEPSRPPPGSEDFDAAPDSEAPESR